MTFTAMLDTPGEHNLIISGSLGNLEVVVTIPKRSRQYIALLGHPHSLQGGTMNNKVITTLSRAFRELDIPSIRFNFRGVGQTQGHFDEGVGESQDMLFLAEQWCKERNDSRFIFAGFSFGSYVAYRAAAQSDASLLLTIAPPVHHFDYEAFTPAPHPWSIIQGKEDEVVPAELVFTFAKRKSLPMIELDTGHFFHGKLVELKSSVMEVIQTQVHR